MLGQRSDITIPNPGDPSNIWADLTAARAYLQTVGRSCSEAMIDYERPKPRASCMMHFYDNRDTYVRHLGTQYRRWRSGGSEGFTCDGPLRTEEEVSLGMCGSCLKRYGPDLGRPVLFGEDDRTLPPVAENTRK